MDEMTKGAPATDESADEDLALAWDDLRAAISRMETTTLEGASARISELGAAAAAMDDVVKARLRHAGQPPSKPEILPIDSWILTAIPDWTAPHEIAERLAAQGRTIGTKTIARRLDALTRRRLASHGAPNNTYRRTAAGEAAIA